jgi:hypothetical protein
MSTRLTDWLHDLKDAGLSDYEIACGLDNGDIDTPEWMRTRPSGATDGYEIWDMDESDGHIGFCTLDDTLPDEDRAPRGARGDQCQTRTA